MGSSDPPGWFFWIALGAMAVALVSLGIFLQTEWVAAVCCAAVGLVVAVLAGVAVLPAITDQNIYGGVKCPHCSARQKIRPWSL
jgi:hypothetical protein